MKSHYLRKKLGRIVLALSFLISIGVLAGTTAQAQRWPVEDQNGRNRDWENQRNRDRDPRNGDWGDWNRDRDYRNDRGRNDRGRNSRGRNDRARNDRYGQDIYQIAQNDGSRDGIYTGQRDAQRGQSYNPQRSHFYQNGHGDNGQYSNNGRYGGGYQYEQAYRQGFLRGYEQGYRQFARNNRRNGNGNYGRWPFLR